MLSVTDSQHFRQKLILLYYFCIQVCLIEETQFSISINNSEGGQLSFIHTESDTIVGALNHIKHRYQLTQPESYTPHTKIKPKDVPGTMLNVVSISLFFFVFVDSSNSYWYVNYVFAPLFIRLTGSTEPGQLRS